KNTSIHKREKGFQILDAACIYTNYWIILVGAIGFEPTTSCSQITVPKAYNRLNKKSISGIFCFYNSARHLA
ncbi:MAG: hypothetical protein ACYCQM_14775, partial [Acidithiobacillus sp.]